MPYNVRMGDMELLFLGTGTSAGIPMIGCKCEVCTSADPRDKRTRPSALLSYDGKRILIDSTPELRIQCVTHGVDMVDAVVFTHAHADHIMGLDDVRRFNVISGRPMDVWANARTMKSLQQCFSYAFLDPSVKTTVFRPKLLSRLIEGPFEVEGRTWTPVPLLHGEVHVLGFRVGNVAYCTDVSHIPDASYKLLEGVEVLVLDGLQFKPHPTHFSVQEAVAAAERIGAKQTWLTHITHGTTHAESNRQLPPHVQLAYDGLRIEL